jgi:signal transduction histidine kinase
MYALLFSASAVILFAVIYWATALYMTSELDAAIDSDMTELEAVARADGTGALAATIEDRVRQMPAGPMLYLLQDRGGKVLAGNLPGARNREGRFDFAAAWGAGRRRSIHAREIALPGGDYLLVGVAADMRNEMRELILRAFGWSFAITLVLAFGGGAAISGGLLRRVETIGRTAREIMAGDYSRRLPVRGTDDEFDHLAASLNLMLERIESSIEATRQIANDIAHDLRTPLTRLRQRLELARGGARSVDELRAAMDRGIAEVDAILETFGALLRIAEVESGGAVRQFREIDLSGLLSTMAEVYQPMAEDKGQRFAADIAGGLRVSGDHELLARMLANLIENAMKHSPQHAAITLTAAARRDGIEIVLTDTGPGIPEGERDRVFRRFHRLETSRTTPGSGLGLPLVAAVAALHGVDVELGENAPGLRIVLRLAPVPAPRAQARELAAQ